MANLTDIFRPVLERHAIAGRAYQAEFGHERQAVVHCSCREYFRSGQPDGALKLWAAHVADELYAVTMRTGEAMGIRRPRR